MYLPSMVCSVDTRPLNFAAGFLGAALGFALDFALALALVGGLAVAGGAPS